MPWVVVSKQTSVADSVTTMLAGAGAGQPLVDLTITGRFKPLWIKQPDLSDKPH